MNDSTKPWSVLFLFGLVGMVLTTLLTYPYVMDDALITLRYSYNLASSGQPIWNEADVDNPSMGYTSTLWMVLNSIPALFTTNKDVLVQCTRIISGAILVVLLGFVSRWLVNLGYRLRSSLFLIFLLFWNPIVGLHLSSGMETILFGALVFFFAYQIVNRTNYFCILATGFVCYLARPEGGFILLVYWLVELVQSRRWKRSLIAALALTVMLAAYHLAVFRFYGDPLPTPFYVKQASGSLIKMAAVRDTILFIVLSGLPLLGITLLGVREKKNRLATILIVQAAVLAFFLTVEPQMNVVYRYQMPVFFLLYLSTLVAYPAFQSAARWMQVATLLVVVGQLVFNWGVVDMYAKKTGRAAANLTSIGKALAAKNTYVDWMAYGDAGFICYYSNFNSIDLNGLNTKSIARGLVSLEAAVRDPRVKLLLVNEEFIIGKEIIALRNDENDGLEYSGGVPITRDSHRTVVVQVYARDAFVDSSFIAAIPTRPDYEGSWFQSLYYTGRKLLKNR